jgi:hypothetical protein
MCLPENLQSTRLKAGGLEGAARREHQAVTTVVLEINEYNASGNYVVSKLWNHRENKKASMLQTCNIDSEDSDTDTFELCALKNKLSLGQC